VSVARVAPDDAAGALRPELERLIARWLAARVMPAMSFLVALEPFFCAEERRYYVARDRAGAVTGLLVAVPVYGRDGWFFEDILRDPASPKGTTELMIDTAMRDVAASGTTFVTLGLAPLAGGERWQRAVRRMLRGFSFAGGRPLRFALRAIGRAPSPILFALAALLVPWTATLALADTELCFRVMGRRDDFECLFLFHGPFLSKV
jgi:phosphatidylglycerol lysyltransferase